MIKYLFWFSILFVDGAIGMAQCRPPSLFSNPSFENQSCCPDGPGQFNCLDGWQWPHLLASPDYLHTCGYDGILNNPPIYAYPVGYPDGMGAVNVGYCDIARNNEMIQTCITQALDPTEEYSLSAFVGFNKSSSQGALMPMRLALYGSIGSCNLAVSFPGTECPPGPSWDLITEIDYSSSADQGWIFRQSDCFSPARAYNRFVIGTSCSMQTCGSALLDLVELQACSELLEADLTLQPQTCVLPSKIDGAIYLDIKNGRAPYTFDWDNDGVGDNDDPQNLENIPSGSYAVIVTDADGLTNCFNVFVPLDAQSPLNPSFDAVDPICYGSIPPALRSRTINRPRVSGSWSPSRIDSLLIGTRSYVFTPDDGICANTFSLDVTVLDTTNLNRTIYEQRCTQDGYELFINGTRYNEANPSGVERITSSEGCDTTVIIQLDFLDAYFDTLRYEGCSGDGYAELVNSRIYDEANSTGQETTSSINGCDSTIIIDFKYRNIFEFETSFVKNEDERLLLDISGIIDQIPFSIRSILWTNPDLINCLDCIGPEFLGTNDQPFLVALTDENGCEHYISVDVEYKAADLDLLFIPNVFTPNNDGLNDRFQVFSGKPSEIIVEEFKIYNRYGGLVHSAGGERQTLENTFWDGTSANLSVQPGVYVYLISIRLATGQLRFYQGDLTVLK